MSEQLLTLPAEANDQDKLSFLNEMRKIVVEGRRPTKEQMHDVTKILRAGRSEGKPKGAKTKKVAVDPNSLDLNTLFE